MEGGGEKEKVKHGDVIHTGPQNAYKEREQSQGVCVCVYVYVYTYMCV